MTTWGRRALALGTAMLATVTVATGSAGTAAASSSTDDQDHGSRDRWSPGHEFVLYETPAELTGCGRHLLARDRELEDRSWPPAQDPHRCGGAIAMHLWC